MHELGIATGIMETALEHARGRPVVSMSLSVGVNSGVLKESLLFYMELLFKERGLEPARIVWKDVPLRFVCECGKTYETPVFLSSCPACGSTVRDLTGGGDCILESIEVDDG